MFAYRLFGLEVLSELALPELDPAQSKEAVTPDVVIRVGAVPKRLGGAVQIDAAVAANSDRFLLDYPPIRFLVTGGKEIIVDRGPGASERNTRAYLLGSAFGAICHQRGLIPLHANAVVMDGRAIAFAGPSGAGKSTLAAVFHDRGRQLLSDDVCVVKFDSEKRPLAWPGVPRIKLWPDASAATGRSGAGLEPVFDGEAKFQLRLDQRQVGPAPLAHVYLLTRRGADHPTAVKLLKGVAAFEAVSANIYRREFAGAAGIQRRLFENLIRLLSSVKIFEISRSGDLRSLAGEVEALEAHIRQEFRRERADDR